MIQHLELMSNESRTGLMRCRPCRKGNVGFNEIQEFTMENNQLFMSYFRRERVKIAGLRGRRNAM